MVNYRTRLKAPRKGVCTSYLSTLVPGNSLSHPYVALVLISSKGVTILVGISRGFVTLPDDLTTPIICVGPGTGVAPMRAIIQHRLKLGAKGKIPRQMSTLFHATLNAYFPRKKIHSILAVDQQAKTSTTPSSGNIASSLMISSIDSLRPVTVRRVFGGLTCSTSSNKTQSIFGMWLGRKTDGCISQGDDTFREWPNKLFID